MKKIIYTPVIGLETHVELSTKSKMFCSCEAKWFGKKANTVVCPVCLGLPGALPVANREAIYSTIKIGLALHCKINLISKFDRKNYFYPDLPKGYQISQYDDPFCVNGFVNIGSKKIRIRRVHLEEDTGKLIHSKTGKSHIDFNRSGVPLVEIVTEPDMHSADEAVTYLKQLQSIVKSLSVSDADMEKGSMRLEPNISLFQGEVHDITEQNLPSYKVEVKNINSFRFAKRAIEYELNRHERLLKEGTIPAQETRGWNETTNATVSQRLKEEAADYRYFPDPDLPPVHLDQSLVDEIQSSLPMLPEAIYDTLKDEYKIRKDYVQVIAADTQLAQYVLRVLQKTDPHKISYDSVVGMIVNKKVDISLNPDQLVHSIIAKQSAPTLGENELSEYIQRAIDLLPQAVADYRAGKEQALGVLIGKVMQLSNGKAKAQDVGQKLRSVL